MNRLLTDVDMSPDGRPSGRPSLATMALTIMLLMFGMPPALADEKPNVPEPVEQVLARGGPAPLRFTLTDGETAIGRVVRVDAETITIRKPTGGVRALSIADLQSIEIIDADGVLVKGRVVLLADGSYGWGKAAPPAGEKRSLAAAIDPAEKPDAGGPLIKLGTETLGRDLDGATPVKTPAAAPKDVALVQPSPTDAGTSELPAPVRLFVTADEVSETEKFLYFQLRLSEPARQPLAIIYTMIDGTATAAQDFTHRQGVVVFKPGQTLITLATPIIDDDAREASESFHLFVTADPASVIINKRNVLATILDDDGDG